MTRVTTALEKAEAIDNVRVAPLVPLPSSACSGALVVTVRSWDVGGDSLGDRLVVTSIGMVVDGTRVDAGERVAAEPVEVGALVGATLSKKPPRTPSTDVGGSL